MSNISIVEAKLPPGFRFHPRDEELVCDYLMKKVMMISNHQFLDEHLLMIEVDLNKCEPWDIPETARVGGKEWYFYSRRDRKYATGLRTNRATATGYWKATGKDRPIYRKSTLVGMRKTLVFYQGRAPKGRKSEWVMHEFRLEGPLVPPKISSQKEDWVLGRVFYKNREIAAKPSVEISCHDDDTGSSSLPGLIDSYITFDQTQPNLQYEHEQVPCFSIFSQDQTNNQTFPHTITQHHMEVPDNLSIRNNCSPFGQLPLLTTPNNLDSLSRDNNKVLKAVLTHLTKMGSSHNIEQSPSLGEGSSESYLSEVAMPNAWNLY